MQPRASQEAAGGAGAFEWLLGGKWPCQRWAGCGNAVAQPRWKIEKEKRWNWWMRTARAKEAGTGGRKEAREKRWDWRM